MARGILAYNGLFAAGLPEVGVFCFPENMTPKPPHDVMAGCVSVPEAVDWSKGKQISDLFDLLMALEADTFDLYLKLGRQVA